MEETISHKGYRLTAQPLRRVRDGRWTTRVLIGRDHAGERRENFFYATDTFESRDDAVRESLAFGRRVVDGEVEGVSLAGL
jgi:hypothetical protein